MQVRVTGVEDMTRRLRRYGAEAEQAMDVSLRKAAEDAKEEAQRMVKGGPKTGRVYTEIFRMIGGRPVPVGPRRGNNLGAVHQASAPGQAPATDTGALLRSIKSVRIKDSDYAIGTSLDYGRHLEFGTRLVEPRPWLFPSVQKAIPGLRRRLEEALRRLGRGR